MTDLVRWSDALELSGVAVDQRNSVDRVVRDRRNATAGRGDRAVGVRALAGDRSGARHLGEILRLTLLGNYERMTAATAKQIGLISEVVKDDSLIEKALWLAESIAAQPPIAVQASLRAIWAANDLGRLDAMALAPSLLTTGMSKSSLKEGQNAFESGKRIEHKYR